MKILITGCAGFIGYHLVKSKLKIKNIKVYGIDNLEKIKDFQIKSRRLKDLTKNKNFIFFKLDISNYDLLKKNFTKYKYDHVFHLAAQTGVRDSINYPEKYVKNNIIGFYNVLNCSKLFSVKHFIMASTSSVYGNSAKFPLKENNSTDFPVSFYAATKKSNEVIAYSYSKLFKVPITVLRFFTVYGPYSRPDMAIYSFTRDILNNKVIRLYNNGNNVRDFTYIDDVVNCINKISNHEPKGTVPYEIYNVSSSKAISVKKLVKLIENHLDKIAKVKFVPHVKGDVFKTLGSSKKLREKIGKINFISQNTGINNFIHWYKSYKK